MLKDSAVSIVRSLQESGYQAYFVGGCVRDMILGREPADDYAASDATPHQVMRIFPETYGVRAKFGVVLVPAPSHNANENEVVEVATFRSDIGYSDGRHPDQVRYSKDPREDVERRDFTVNGLLMNPINQEVIDFVGGRKDLEFRTIRAIGEPERRFTEDKLRML